MSLLIILVGAQRAIAQAPPTESDQPSETAVETAAPVDPYQAVHEGNLLFKEGKYDDALEQYEQARKEKPDAREIAFAQGLSQYHLGDYERARDLFRKAAAGKNDALADDVTYSIGTTYHSDALLSKDDSKAALSQLEQAMEHYQNVLNHDPDHTAARDAYRKAGTTWRTIKQQMQQQQQQPQQSDNQDQNDENENENQKQDQQKSDQKQEQSEQQDQQQSDDQEPSEDQEQDQSEQDQQQNQQEQNDQNQQQDEQQSSESQNEQEEQGSSAQQQERQQEEQQQASAEQKEQVSKEQAERKLREMMQAIRERKERRRQPTKLVPVRPVDKDW